MIDMDKINRLRTMAQNPSESEYLQALVTILVELEHRQLERVEQLHDALDLDGIEVQSTRESREEQLLELAEHAAQGNFTEWWFKNVVGEHIENPEDAKPYAGLSEDDWQNQIEAWADGYRSRSEGEFEELADREIAGVHVEKKFGVSLGEFEREVVQYERKDALRTVLAGNFEAVEAGIQAATHRVEAAKDAAQDAEGGDSDE